MEIVCTPPTTVLQVVADETEVGEARRFATALARQIGFNDTQQGNVALIVTELARNVLLHAGGGEILLQRTVCRDEAGLDILAVDRGPGMDNVAECLRDGFSTAGTAGTGLGAIKRKADLCDIYSRPGQGTVLLARLWARPGHAPPPSCWQIGAVSVARAGLRECGDAWACKLGSRTAHLFIVDGLGHGAAAAEAATAAVQVFTSSELAPELLLNQMHDRLRRTRGAAVALATVSSDRKVQFWGVGNIAAGLVSQAERTQMVSLHGTVGLELPRLRSFEYAWNKDRLLVLHSDGLSNRWQLDSYPGLLRRDPSVIAGVLHRDFGRPSDDATIVVLRARMESSNECSESGS